MRWLTLCGLLLACNGSEAIPQGTCAQACANITPTAAQVTGLDVGVIDAMCADAPDLGNACGECLTWLNDTVYEPVGVTWSCGCGVTVEAIDACADGELDEPALEDELDVCLDVCEANDLAP